MTPRFGRLLYLPLAFTLVAGCAGTPVVVDGKRVARLDLDFAGQPFAVRFSGAHPAPGGPSSGVRGYGGRLSGNVCGIDLVYDVEHEGEHTRLTGFIDNGAYDSSLELADRDDMTRVISGQLARGVAVVSLEVRVNRIRGGVGLRAFDLGRVGDEYVGVVEYVSAVRMGRRTRAAAVIRGADALWTLPPAAQAAVLPALLTCYGDELEDKNREKLVVGFGGRQSWESARVSAIYHANGEFKQAGDAARPVMYHDPVGTQQQGGRAP